MRRQYDDFTQLKLKDMIAIYYTRGLGNFDLSDELIVEIFLSHPKTFVEILKQNPFYIDIIIQNFELIKNNENILKNISGLPKSEKIKSVLEHFMEDDEAWVVNLSKMLFNTFYR